MSQTRIPRDPADDYSAEAVAARHALCERVAARPLPHLAGAPVAPASARGKIENLSGFAQVPLGLAGPLELDTHRGRREFLVPMATTEGALVASYSRGMKLLSAAGTARARVLARGLSQHPMLVYADAASATRARESVAALRAEFERRVAALTQHGKLVAVEPEQVGRRLVLRLVFTTGDALGINMAARAADELSALLAEKSGALERYVHGEDVEKRASTRALAGGRGRDTVCDARIPRALLREHLRVTPEALAAIQASYRIGYARLGTHNWLVQAANGLAAVFLACGQDVAYVGECAQGFLELEVDAAGDLHAAAHLPALLVGTVGGGTAQGTAAECLALLGVGGEGGADLFAELLAATVLAGDLSLMASFCTHEFVAAHERLGRNRPVRGAGS
jgi:hydroxymethylglutaryl-CoA reductase (NADPH)